MGKISIIVPVYNRENLIIQTLDSIKNQTYDNFECIIIDDGSTDNTVQIIKNHIKDDSRFYLKVRPLDINKGANACRNIGINAATGFYMIFFDSDDLMAVEHLEKKIKAIQYSNADIVISKTVWFNHPKEWEEYDYSGFDLYEINAENFITKKIHWLTPDPMIKTSISKKVFFDTKINSAGEYSYFCKISLLTDKIFFFDEVLSYRRFHENSHSLIENFQKSSQEKYEKLFNDFYNCYKETMQYNPTKKTRKYLFDNALFYLHKNRNIKVNKIVLFRNLIRERGLLSAIKFISIFINIKK